MGIFSGEFLLSINCFRCIILLSRSWGSSISTVSDYRLDEGVTAFRSAVDIKFFL
jgi:hypothetical protein